MKAFYKHKIPMSKLLEEERHLVEFKIDIKIQEGADKDT